jgi:hypothetical protein
MQAYSNPSREPDPHALPDVEVFYVTRGASGQGYVGETIIDDNQTEEPLEQGYYYWFCFPGCLPDSGPIGPFDTQEDALADAQQGAEEE